MKRWRSIPTLPLQLFIITVVPLTVLLLAITFGSLGLHQRAMRAMVGERDERATRAAVAAITEQINHRWLAIRGVALQAANTAGPDHALDDASYLLPDFEGGIALFTVGGDLLTASNDIEIWRARDIPQRLRTVTLNNSGSLSAEEPNFLPLLTGPENDEALTLVAATAGELTAVGAFSPSSMARRALAGIFSNNDQAVAYIVTAGGDILYQTGTLPWAGTPPQEHSGVADALRGESGATYITIDGDEHVIAFSPIVPTGWALVIVEPWRTVGDPLLRTTELAPLILIPVLVIALVALWFGARQVVRPLQSLEQKATHLGWGDFAAIEEPVGGINEIRRLQTELIHMARKVQLAQQSLRGYLGAVTTGQEEERRRLARDLHDDTIQSLIALNQQIQLAQLAAPDEAPTARLAAMQQMIEQIVADLRRLTRNLRPIYLEDLGLVPALEMLVRDVSQVMGIPVSFTTTGRERRLASPVELALYRITQEGLSNVARHARAKKAEVCLQFKDEEVSLTVQDDGIGFIVPESPAEMAPTGHFGLLGVQERAEAIGARLQIKSVPGTGTELVVRLLQP
jgi:signal transduction histidine kinase